MARSGNESPAQKAQISEFSSALSAALLKLSESHRTVFMLHAAEGMSYKEISHATGLSMSNVGFLIHTAIKTLRRALEDQS